MPKNVTEFSSIVGTTKPVEQKVDKIIRNLCEYIDKSLETAINDYPQAESWEINIKATDVWEVNWEERDTQTAAEIKKRLYALYREAGWRSMIICLYKSLSSYTYNYVIIKFAIIFFADDIPKKKTGLEQDHVPVFCKNCDRFKDSHCIGAISYCRLYMENYKRK